MIALKIDAKFEGKLTCAFKNDMQTLANFHRMKNSDFILESKMAELYQNKNSQQPDRPDAVWKLHFTLKSDSHLPEKFCLIKIIPSLVQKNTIICLLGV